MAGTDIRKSDNKDKESIKQRVSNFVAFFNTIDQLLGVIDYEGRFVDVNRSGLDLLEYGIDLFGRGFCQKIDEIFFIGKC